MPKPSFNDFPAPKQAGILCNDERFQKFAAIRCGLPDQTFCQSATAQYLRQCCGIESRRELESDPNAQDRLQVLRTEFDVWTGKQAAPR
ncbi:hypothetical protein DS909_01630 [Phaeobacter gallaeciensis]|uniref:Uncharacterized protein n=1 Tax=Phaeobacter gallaeciensis TaxID=60890 RepID=A0A366X872_9RHOB|nr:hypothetical protein [Phaeobacter gallaeciensis]RBW61441.1 hypothetical protein DS909_01630 [Phaeobacter gallaeciensis]